MLGILDSKQNLYKFIFFNFFKNTISSRINQVRHSFCHVYEMRITFSNSFRDMTSNYHLKQQLPLFEVRLNQILAKNP